MYKYNKIKIFNKIVQHFICVDIFKLLDCMAQIIDNLNKNILLIDCSAFTQNLILFIK